ncbi:MAG: type II toxin-antitoxin system Phd/YefM family antitoxin [Bacilli bacterium]|nr:type II toxin-antitoxin system Phd/YefM family antitoxin [Bacilli bacterium]
MCTITATELKRNFGKYALLAEKEEIVVTKRGKEVFSLMPTKIKRYQEAMSLIGILPADAKIGVDPDERG